MSDNVNNPKHYDVGKFQCIDVMEEIFGEEAVNNFCLLNTFKYIWRANRKNGLEDLEKAQWYLNRLIEQRKELLNNEETKYIE